MPDWAEKRFFWLFLLSAMCCSFAAQAQQPVFPLQISENHRYLQDTSGRPFLLTGDSAWSLIGDLSREDADMYLADRQSRGFNTILVSLIEHRFSRNAPNNYYKHAPFASGGNFTKPNEAYFADADWILERARERGFLVLLTPAYLGTNGGDEGWYQEMHDAGADALRSYGRYLGQRYRHFDNIIWVQGGDWDPPTKTLVDALAQGIKETNPEALQTVHAGRDTDVLHSWEEEWLGLDTVYTYGDVRTANLKRYLSGRVRPFFFIEGMYEGEHNTTEQTIREIAYGSILSGAAGQVFGNNPVWHFAGPALFPRPVTWQKALSSRGAESMSLLKAFFDAIAWWTLEPEQGKLLVVPQPPLAGYAIGSRSAAGNLAVIYLSDRSSVTLDKAALAPTTRHARWFDPSSGQFSEAVAKSGSKANTLAFDAPQAQNSSGFSDWLLLLTDTD
ncbi:DUF4038 domain-containing protein [Phyllobacterium bourgognense]|uniref:Collagenase-like protein with putative collagen-binding domain n=1 Tax=Phyllobacterium bourgognense TaxID=314236 RepID=A0A368Z801_9HYPH|nr:DUF4038 domain-containing protein [Phyllobacterium bourgognense]RCW87626.1 collagenase-like protein with putative collagen-binding domain [Phyllobacterium bourgognense]